jgi:hypothetical protein
MEQTGVSDISNKVVHSKENIISRIIDVALKIDNEPLLPTE